MLPLTYLFEHSLGVRDSGSFLPPPSVGEMLACGQLVHGHHGAGRLLPSQLQHGEEVEGHRAHVGQGANLNEMHENERLAN